MGVVALITSPMGVKLDMLKCIVGVQRAVVNSKERTLTSVWVQSSKSDACIERLFILQQMGAAYFIPVFGWLLLIGTLIKSQ